MRSLAFDGRLATLLVVGFWLTACSPPGSPADAYRASPQDMQRGKALFAGTCAGYCHSPAVERDAPYLFDCTWVHGSGTDAEIFEVIAQGLPGTPMLGFQNRLPEGDTDIWRLVAYITETGAQC